MKRLSLFVLMVLILLFCVNAWGMTYTVGSSDCDYTNIQAVFDNEDLEPGDVVEIQADTVGGSKVYHEAVTISSEDSGSITGYVTLKARRGDTIIIDPTEAIEGWVSAPEIGSGVYKKENFTYDPGIVTVNNHRVAEINSTKMGNGDGDTMLAYPANQTVTSSCFPDTDIYFWDTCEILTGYKSSNTTLYYRERNGNAPSFVRASQSLFAINISSASYIVVDGLQIRGAYYGIELDGSSNCVVRNCLIKHSNHKVYILNSSSAITVSHNVFRSDYYVQTYGNDSIFGAYTPTENYLNALRCYIYNFFKYIIGNGASNDHAIEFINGGSNSIFENNNIGYGLIGISGYSTGTPIDGIIAKCNYIHHMNSIGLTSDRGTTNYYIVRNKFYDCNIALRMHYILHADVSRSVCVIHNLFVEPSNDGIHIYIWDNISTDPGDDSYYYIYNNTLYGGKDGMYATSAIRTAGVDHTYIKNNIVAGASNGYAIAPLLNDGGCGGYDYNCHEGTKPGGYDDSIFGTHSLLETDPKFVNSSANNFHLSSDSPCRNAGDSTIYSTEVRDLDGWPVTDSNGNPIDEMPIGAYWYRSWAGLRVVKDVVRWDNNMFSRYVVDKGGGGSMATN